MTQDFFKTQLERLRTRFGERNFDNEFVLLVWREVKDMSEAGFARFVDVLIGSRTANKPPLLSEFREARLAEEKIQLENDARGAARAFQNRTGKPIGEVLSPEFGKVTSITEALEIAKLRRLKAES